VRAASPRILLRGASRYFEVLRGARLGAEPTETSCQRNQVWLLDPSSDRVGSDDCRSLVAGEPPPPRPPPPPPDARAGGKRLSKAEREKQAAEYAAAVKAAEKRAAKHAEKVARLRGAPPPPAHGLVLDLASAPDTDVSVVLREPLREEDGSPALLATDTAVPSQRWFLAPDGFLVASVDGGGFCLGLLSTGRIFPSDGAAVVLVPRDSKRALRWTLLPTEAPPGDEDHSTFL